MASSYLNIVMFLVTTLFYYMALKPTLTYDIVSNPETYTSFVSSNYMYLGVYLLLVIMIQFLVNASIITTTCGGSVSENMGAAGAFTFIPWFLIFGVIVIVLVIYPGFKSAFSDVIGYYYVSTKANELLIELLASQGLESAPATPATAPATTTAETISPTAPPASAFLGPKAQTGGTKEELQKASDLILKICGNTSILINQMVPSNFDSYWKLLNPLKKEKYQMKNGDEISNDAQQLKKQLFDLVVTRDTIGEALWYIYTGLLLTSIVQLKMTSRGCATNPQTMEANYAKFQEQEAAAQKQAASATSTTYTITN
jgi:hypothetical protein